MKFLLSALAAGALILSWTVHADSEGKGKDKSKKHDAPPSATSYAPGKNGGKPTFSESERSEIRGYFDSHPGERDALPPGLAKKNKIPPGWQKKLARGQRIPDDVWVHHVPLPHDILIKLPPPPPGVVIVRVNDRILRVVEKTHELLDELGLPHPPTPKR